MTISDLAVRIDEAGIDAVVPALRAESEQLAEIARRAHVSDALTDTLTSDRVGDIMWLRAFCPQACYAGGPGRFRYLLYKDVNRHARL